MSLFKRSSRRRDGDSSRLEPGLPGRGTTQSSISLPSMSAMSSSPTLPGYPASLRSEINVSNAPLYDSKKPGEQEQGSSLTLVVPTQASNEVSLLHQTANTSDRGQTQAQPASPRIFVENSSLVAGPSRLPAPSASSWTGLKTLLRVLNQSRAAFGPLKYVIEDLIPLLDIHVVSVLISFHQTP